MFSKRKLPLLVSIAALTLAGCSNFASNDQITLQQKLDEQQAENKALKSQITKLEAQPTKEVVVEKEVVIEKEKTVEVPANRSSISGDLLPPGAKAGECYARIWVEPEYKTITKQMLVREADEKIEIIPAKYEWVEEKVLVKEGSKKLISKPATYKNVTEQILVTEAAKVWRQDLRKNAAPVSNDLLKEAKAGGADIDSATPGMCFHEHYHPEEFTTAEKQVLAKEAHKKIETTPAVYEWAEEKVLVKEASSTTKTIPAVYDWTEEKVIDKPAHTVWKKGTGPIQRIDESTGEIMCLVEVPATYKTVRKQIVKVPARTEKIETPAEYKTIKVRKLATTAKEVQIDIPAEYKSVTTRTKAKDATFVWHEIHNTDEPSHTRTGRKVCLTEQAAEYKTVTRSVVATPATTTEIDVPAEYKTIKVRKIVSAEQEKRTQIPAEYKTVTLKELQTDGNMEWRSILCATNMTNSRITSIQRALKEQGYNPGPIDGAVGSETMAAVNKFQRDNKLTVSKYIDVETVKALGINPN